MLLQLHAKTSKQSHSQKNPLLIILSHDAVTFENFDAMTSDNN